MSTKNILESLVNVSEKAANIARVFRQNEHLFGLLVQEKEQGNGANTRFVHDYKTLADVLIQEMIRHDIGTAVNICANLCVLIMQFRIPSEFTHMVSILCI